MENSDSEFNYIEWEPKYSVGIEVIDEQHKKLFSLCNNLYRELMKHKKVGLPSVQDALSAALKECVDYVHVHFEFEEKLMAAGNYPDFNKHKASHIEFIKKVVILAKNFNATNFITSLQFVKFLYDWILTHIAYEDKLYVPYLKNDPDLSNE